MFTESSEYYDLIYSFKDYEEESKKIRDIIRDERPHRGQSLLDIGCGTGEHHCYLKKHYSIDGIDLNERFIEIARTKNPELTYSVANMIDFKLNKQYDVITCLFSSIGYLNNINEINSALKCFYKHLAPGGLLLLEPWFTKKNWRPGKLYMLTSDSPEHKICRMGTSYMEGDYSILNFHYLLGLPEEGIKHFFEEHRLRLTSHEEMKSALINAGFTVRFDAHGLIGRGLFYGVKGGNHIEWV